MFYLALFVNSLPRRFELQRLTRVAATIIFYGQTFSLLRQYLNDFPEVWREDLPFLLLNLRYGFGYVWLVELHLFNLTLHESGVPELRLFNSRLVSIHLELGLVLLVTRKLFVALP